jgi:hypothetical protein
VEVGVDGVGDDANWVGRLLVEVVSDFFKDVVCDVVGRVIVDDICEEKRKKK